MPLEFGTVSIIALLSFLLGRLWHHSEIIMLGRQRAYASFLGKCLLPGELALPGEKPEIESLILSLREAGAEVSLYASDHVNKSIGKYLGKIGYLIGAFGMPPEELSADIAEANSLYDTMIAEMRRDVLSWSLFGASDRLFRKRTK